MKPFRAASPLFAFGLLLPLLAGAGNGDPQIAVTGEQVVEAEVAWQGTVTSVEPGQRLLSLRDAEGRERTVRVDEQVQRLERMRPGDRVEVYYRRSLVFDMQPAGSAEPGAYIWEDEQHPDPERPGVVDREMVEVLSPLVAVDAAANTISVQAPNGSVHVLDVEEPRHREALSRLSVGDLLRIRFLRLLAVRVVPAE